MGQRLFETAKFFYMYRIVSEVLVLNKVWRDGAISVAELGPQTTSIVMPEIVSEKDSSPSVDVTVIDSW
jgi:hypothetical protein